MMLGVVLAGGQSSRFGSDKGQALWRGMMLIDHVRSRLATVSAKVVISDRIGDGPERVADRPGPGLGPLAGLAAALHFAGQHGFDRVISAPCDTPMLDDGLLAVLASTHEEAFLVGLPVIGSWRVGQAERLEDHLRRSDDRSVRHWAGLIGARPLDLPPPPNINRRADLEALGG